MSNHFVIKEPLIPLLYLFKKGKTQTVYGKVFNFVTKNKNLPKRSIAQSKYEHSLQCSLNQCYKLL